jgi:uncharacterized protein YqjF (DUF2071 family)
MWLPAEPATVFEFRMGVRHLLLASWPVEPAVVGEHLPAGLAVDTYDDQAWLSVVPFTYVDLRPTWAPPGLGMRVHQVNLRTYVTHDGDPGTYFLSLDAASVLGTIGGRLSHGLPFHLAAIDFEEGPPVRVDARRRRAAGPPVRFRAAYEPIGDAFTADPGSLEAFVAERYRSYADAGDGGLRVADLEHEPWHLFDAGWDLVANDLFEAAAFDDPAGDPHLLYSPGLEAYVSRSRPLEPASRADAASPGV